MTQISILGCGWLGLPLAEKLIEGGFSVNGSTTSSDKIEILKQSGINPFLIQINENSISGNIQDFLKNSEVIIIDIPPKLRGTQKENFVSKVNQIIKSIEGSKTKKVLFISSTSVYADDNSEIKDETIPQPDTESGTQMLEAENLLKDNPNFKTTILRFGGLIGNNRHPIHFLAGRKNIENPDAPINLIHQDDCIDIITKIIEKDIWNETFNAVAPFHPTRKEYYTRKAKELSLPLPEFTADDSKGKIIYSDKLKQLLNYQFTGNL